VNFSAFQSWREHCLRSDPDLLDCAETNLYRALARLQPKPAALNPNRPVHRCDLARAWIHRFGFPEKESSHALVCSGVRHALGLIFQELAKDGAVVWIPCDVYPIYLDLARKIGIEPFLFSTLPQPKLPDARHEGRREYMVVTNPWKPLGRFLTDEECDALTVWVNAAPDRYLLVDCVYDLGTPFHPTTQRLWDTGRAILLHSLTKGWLWPKTFGVALMRSGHERLESVLRDNSPSQEQLSFAEKLLSTHIDLPSQIVATLGVHKRNLLAVLSAPVQSRLLLNPACLTPGCYFFAVGIRAEELLQQHRILAIPASTFGAEWDGSIITSLAESFAPKEKEAAP
jgi:hypothetical protein